MNTIKKIILKPLGKIRELGKRLFSSQKNSFNDAIPWMTFSAISWLEKYLKKEMNVFEWGSGGSTLYIAPRVRTLISIEHDARWHAKVIRRLRSEKITNCECVLIAPVIDRTNESGSGARPSQYKSSSETYRAYDFEAYCTAIDRFPDGYFDLIIIDGRARPSCMLHARNKAKQGGYILVDDSDRAAYDEGFALLGNYTRTDFHGSGPYLDFPWSTSIFKRID